MGFVKRFLEFVALPEDEEDEYYEEENEDTQKGEEALEEKDTRRTLVTVIIIAMIIIVALIFTMATNNYIAKKEIASKEREIDRLNEKIVALTMQGELLSECLSQLESIDVSKEMDIDQIKELEIQHIICKVVQDLQSILKNLENEYLLVERLSEILKNAQDEKTELYISTIILQHKEIIDDLKDVAKVYVDVLSQYIEIPEELENMLDDI